MEFSFPTRIVFGAGTLNQLPELVTELGMKHPMIVTDPGLVKAGLINQVTDRLTNFSVFDRVVPNPTEDNVFEGVRCYNRERCDGILGVGGGSALDAGKIIGLMTTHVRPLADYDDNTGGDRLIGPDIPPIIAIPTTAGTGSRFRACCRRRRGSSPCGSPRTRSTSAATRASFRKARAR